ncbi:MAG: hypothetical protein ACAH83_16160 [Alphaproteobacteria bacterium]
MKQAIAATALFMQTLVPTTQDVRMEPVRMPSAPIVQALQTGGDDKKPKPDDDNKGKLSLVFSGAAYHFGQREYWENGHKRHFNEINPGIGVEYGLGKLGPFNTYLTAGVYKNSVYNTSKYVAAGIETNGSKFLGGGIEGGLLTGYPDMKVPIAAIPYVRVGEADGINLKVNVIPPIKNLTPMTVGVQVRVPLGPK